MSKIGQMISMLLLSGLLLSGGDVSNEMSIRLTAVTAAVFCAIGLVLLLMYNEKKILEGITNVESK
jgi:GPH family glycoside/pentoside/hexuronide:cation symporter